MRVLVVTNMYPPHHYGGYELSCQDTARNFESKGHTVAILTSDIRVQGVVDIKERPSLVFRDLRMYWQDHELLSPPLRERIAIERHNQGALERALSLVRPDVVSVWNMGALSLGILVTLKRQAVPIVYVLGDDWPVYAQTLDAWSRMFRPPPGRALAAPVRVVYRVPTTVPDFSTFGPFIFNSRCMEVVVRERSGLSVPDSTVLHPGVDTTDFPIVPAQHPIHERPWRGRLLYVGRIDERKGTDTAIRALTFLPDARLRIIGRGDAEYEAHLRTVAIEGRVSERVEFATVPRNQLANEYADADALLFTSVYQEPFGIVPLEGMACDTPVIATGTGGSGEYLESGVNCILYRPGDPAALAESVRRISRDPGLRSTLVAGGRQTAGRLTADAYAENLLSWHTRAARL